MIEPPGGGQGIQERERSGGTVDRARLERELRAEYGDQRASRVVARQARDLADSEQLQADLGVELTVETVLSNLADAPEEYALSERWNWWMGALDVSHGGYLQFTVRTDSE